MYKCEVDISTEKIRFVLIPDDAYRCPNEASMAFVWDDSRRLPDQNVALLNVDIISEVMPAQPID